MTLTVRGPGGTQLPRLLLGLALVFALFWMGASAMLPFLVFLVPRR